MRSILLTLCISAAMMGACTPPAPSAQQATTPSPDATSEAVLSVLTPIVAADIGREISLRPSTVNVQNEWAYVAAHARNTDGSEIDWATTNLASRYENGVMDSDGGVHALLRNEGGVWTVLEYVLAPTDVAWLDWASRHGAPEDIVDVPTPP